MSAVLGWGDPAGLAGQAPSSLSSLPSALHPSLDAPSDLLERLPAGLDAALWRGSDLGRSGTPVWSSGFAALDQELPGGGWPTRSLTELLTSQPAVLEWRLLGPALAVWLAATQARLRAPGTGVGAGAGSGRGGAGRGLRAAAGRLPGAGAKAAADSSGADGTGLRRLTGPESASALGGAASRPARLAQPGAAVAPGQIVLVGPPRTPHLPGLAQLGLDERHWVWIQAQTPAERLWCTEQLLKAGGSGVLLSWLPQARPEQIRRLQLCAQAFDGPVFLCRPLAARHEASAAPLRLQAGLGSDWALRVQLFKRRGPAHEGWLSLPAVPGRLATVLSPRGLAPTRLREEREARDARLGSAERGLRPPRRPVPAVEAAAQPTPSLAEPEVALDVVGRPARPAAVAASSGPERA
ncbi:MAG: hypothetical protein RL722_17 [Pseudomonadota bacterium]|jgi:protein ImuA